MATDKERAKQRTELLATLRQQHQQTVAEDQDYLKEQKRVRRVLLQALADGPLSVPQLAEATDVPSHEVLWHIAALKKYGTVEESGIDEDYEYHLYGLTKEGQS